jgi:hypothetical protein
MWLLPVPALPVMTTSTAYEVESRELDDGRAIELRLKVEVEGFERLSFLEAC